MHQRVGSDLRHNVCQIKKCINLSMSAIIVCMSPATEGRGVCLLPGKHQVLQLVGGLLCPPLSRQGAPPQNSQGLAAAGRMSDGRRPGDAWNGSIMISCIESLIQSYSRTK